jgi:hypothetical protein
LNCEIICFLWNMFILQNIYLNFFILCYYSGTMFLIRIIISLILTEVLCSWMLLKTCHLKISKNIIYGILVLDYNDVEIDITWRCLVGEHQYFPTPIICDVDFRNIMELFIQSETNITELYVSSRRKFSSSYNGSIEILIYLYPCLLSHLSNYHI